MLVLIEKINQELHSLIRWPLWETEAQLLKIVEVARVMDHVHHLFELLMRESIPRKVESSQLRPLHLNKSCQPRVDLVMHRFGYLPNKNGSQAKLLECVLALVQNLFDDVHHLNN